MEIIDLIYSNYYTRLKCKRKTVNALKFLDNERTHFYTIFKEAKVDKKMLSVQFTSQLGETWEYLVFTYMSQRNKNSNDLQASVLEKTLKALGVKEVPK